MRSSGTCLVTGGRNGVPPPTRIGFAEDAQLVDEAELDRCRGEARAADLDVLVGGGECRGDLVGEWRLGEARVCPERGDRIW